MPTHRCLFKISSRSVKLVAAPFSGGCIARVNPIRDIEPVLLLIPRTRSRQARSTDKPLSSPFLSCFFVIDRPRPKAQLESSYCLATWYARASLPTDTHTQTRVNSFTGVYATRCICSDFVARVQVRIGDDRHASRSRATLVPIFIRLFSGFPVWSRFKLP